eukprot:2134942-Amphidinium_carterae.4
MHRARSHREETRTAKQRAENRELRLKLDEVLARLASTGVDGDHYEKESKDYTTGQYVLYPRTFAGDAGHQIIIGLCRHPWAAAVQLVSDA